MTINQSFNALPVTSWSQMLVCIPELLYSSVTPGGYRSLLIRVCCLFSALRQNLKKNVLLGSSLLAASPFPIHAAFGKAQLRSRLSGYLSSIIFFTSSCTLWIFSCSHSSPWLSLSLSVCQDISWSHHPSVVTHFYHEPIILLLSFKNNSPTAQLFFRQATIPPSLYGRYILSKLDPSFICP